MSGPENSTPERRVIGRPFQPGQSGNPGGRPKAVKKLAEACREFLESEGGDGKTKLEEVLHALYMRATAEGDPTAAKALLDRGWGTPVETKDLNITTDATQTQLGQWLADMDGKSAPKP